MTMGPKQIIVMRTDLNMRKGKMIAQGAHASLGIVLRNQDRPWAALSAWTGGKFTKVCVRVDSLEELMGVVAKARQYGLHYFLVKDEGRTEFKWVPTYTCAATGPEFPEDIDPVTGDLKLL